MDATAAAAAAASGTPRRRNSIEPPSASGTSSSSSTKSSSSTSSSSSSSSSDYELISLKPASYTSLRDLLPSTAAFVQSPKPPSFTVQSGYEISIRNPLVKQAAWAYLQPMSASPGSGPSTVFHRLWTRLSDALLRLVTQICNCFLRSIQLSTTTTKRRF
ncbi:hypothetical protein SSX86_019619 [Deinandra increscens subsp. villosa]|uniref:Uncharacterized protein n=1 Tax=Deinandra increscens subsp. villosa TaxID=3103831 RepID=A0AAP0CXH2_9ASTR